MSAYTPFAGAFDSRLLQAPVAAACPAPARTIRMSIDAASVTALRQLAMRLCGDAFEFMRIAICAGGARIQVWLCVRQPFADLLRATIAERFPGAQVAGCGKEGGPA